MVWGDLFPISRAIKSGLVVMLLVAMVGCSATSSDPKPTSTPEPTATPNLAATAEAQKSALLDGLRTIDPGDLAALLSAAPPDASLFSDGVQPGRWTQSGPGDHGCYFVRMEPEPGSLNEPRTLNVNGYNFDITPDWSLVVSYNICSDERTASAQLAEDSNTMDFPSRMDWGIDGYDGYRKTDEVPGILDKSQVLYIIQVGNVLVGAYAGYTDDVLNRPDPQDPDLVATELLQTARDHLSQTVREQSGTPVAANV